jgi:hypothetical protein
MFSFERAAIDEYPLVTRVQKKIRTGDRACAAIKRH